MNNLPDGLKLLIENKLLTLKLNLCNSDTENQVTFNDIDDYLVARYHLNSEHVSIGIPYAGSDTTLRQLHTQIEANGSFGQLLIILQSMGVKINTGLQPQHHQLHLGNKTYYLVIYPAESGVNINFYEDPEANLAQQHITMFNALFANHRNAIIVLNTNRFVIQSNRQAEKYFQLFYHEQFDTGRSFDTYVTPIHRQQFINDFEKALHGRIVVNEGSARSITGKKEYFEITYYPVFSQGVCNQVIAEFRNVTRHKIIEQKYNDTLVKADESERLKRTFLTNMSHEIRTPMNGIMGFSELLKRPGLSDVKREKYTKLISTNSKNLLEIFEEILDVSRIESGEMIHNPCSFNINNLLNDLLYYFQSNFNAENNNSAMHFEAYKALENSQAQITGDRGKIRQILLHLIGNSIKYTNSGHIRFGYQLENNNLRLFVCDTGTGIAPYKSDEIFGYFKQPDKPDARHRQSGLGLSLVKNFVQFLGGSINLLTTENLGALFIIDLPNPNNPNENNKKTVHNIVVPQAIRHIHSIFNNTHAYAYNTANDAINAIHPHCRTTLIVHEAKKIQTLAPFINKAKAVSAKVKIIYISDTFNAEDKAICYAAGCDYYLTANADKNFVKEIILDLPFF